MKNPHEVIQDKRNRRHGLCYNCEQYYLLYEGYCQDCYLEIHGPLYEEYLEIRRNKLRQKRKEIIRKENFEKRTKNGFVKFNLRN